MRESKIDVERRKLAAVPVGGSRSMLREPASDPRLEMPLAELGLDPRMREALDAAGVVYVRDVLNRRPDELLSLPNVGEKMLAGVYEALARLGFRRR